MDESKDRKIRGLCKGSDLCLFLGGRVNPVGFGRPDWVGPGRRWDVVHRAGETLHGDMEVGGGPGGGSACWRDSWSFESV